MRRIAVVFLSALLLVHFACGHRKDPQRPVDDGGGRIRIGWIRPSPGDSILADTIRIELAIAGAGIGEAVVTADDSTIAVAQSPPWRVHWLPHGAARRIRLGAAVGSVTAPGRVIRWGPNAPPRVEITGVPAAGGVARDPADSLHSIASDPEDGDLEGEAIVWTSDIQGVLGFGRRIPTESLVCGRHVVRARASDRWGRTSIAERAIEAFDPADPGTPEGAIAALRQAMITADSTAYLSMFDPDFLFLLCPEERRADPSLPPGWGFAEEATFAGRIGNLSRVEWTASSVQRAWLWGEDWAKAEIRGLDLSYEERMGEPLRVFGGAERLYLRRQQGNEVWNVVLWNDLGAAGLSYGRLRLVASARDAS